MDKQLLPGHGAPGAGQPCKVSQPSSVSRSRFAPGFHPLPMRISRA